jgi:C4-dicarboxylate transporter/malic acid transport protein
MAENLTFWDIIKTFESRWFMSIMSTGAVGILTEIIANTLNWKFLNYVASGFIYLAILLLILITIFFKLRIFKFPNEFIKDLKHPIAANFFAGINISLAVLTTGILNVLLVNNHISKHLGLLLAEFFYICAVFIGLLLLVLVPVMLIISSNVDTKHAIGIWFLPPVGMFVVIFAGNFLALHNVFVNFIVHFNFLLFGPAFVLYFLILNLIYYRLKFHPLPAPEVAPSFVIGLAPVGVSIIALQTYDLLLKKLGTFFLDVNLLSNLINIYSVVILGFGIWWFFVTLIILSYYEIKNKIPYSLGFWAFVFPIAAFGIGTNFVSKISNFEFIFGITFALWILVMFVWLYVFSKTMINIITKKAFIRPKVIN